MTLVARARSVIEQADDRVGPGKSDGDSRGAEHDCKRGESVGAGVKTVSNECGRPDLPADADSVARDDLVAGKPDHPGRGDRLQCGGAARRSSRPPRRRRTRPGSSPSLRAGCSVAGRWVLLANGYASCHVCAPRRAPVGKMRIRRVSRAEPTPSPTRDCASGDHRGASRTPPSHPATRRPTTDGVHRAPARGRR